jgi:membrane protease YdiL (CAAX protease family)
MDQHADVPARSRRKLVAWLVFVGVLTALSLSARLAGTEAPDDLAYHYSSSVAALFQYGIMLGILLLIARGLPRRETFALRRPESWSRALGLAALALGTIYVAGYVYDRLLSAFGNWDPTKEQGLVPDEWDSSRAGAFIAFFLVVTFVGPTVEELTYRGLGLSLLMPYGSVAAVLVTGILFGAVHGLLVVLVPLTIFGVVVGWLRVRTRSVYPPIVLHATFNGTALLVSVTLLG